MNGIMHCVADFRFVLCTQKYILQVHAYISYVIRLCDNMRHEARKYVYVHAIRNVPFFDVLPTISQRIVSL